MKPRRTDLRFIRTRDSKRKLKSVMVKTIRIGEKIPCTLMQVRLMLSISTCKEVVSSYNRKRRINVKSKTLLRCIRELSYRENSYNPFLLPSNRRDGKIQRITAYWNRSSGAEAIIGPSSGVRKIKL